MPKALLIAEKPSLEKEIRMVYEKHRKVIPVEITFKSQRGHLVELCTPDELDESLKTWSWDTLPIDPEAHGGWRVKVKTEKKVKSFLTAQERYEEIKKELKSGSYDFVINAGDPDQEGELLIRMVLEHIHNTLPVKRFWTNDLTENAILEALLDLKDDDHDPMLQNLYAAAMARQHSDYLFGINLSRAATLKMDTTVSLGRVETPIQAIVVKREQEIRDFKPSTSYGVQAKYIGDFTGVLYDRAEAVAEEGADEESKAGVVRFQTKAEAQAIIRSLSKKAIVTSYEKKKVRTRAPKLFKLATAQVSAGKHGINDAVTLSAIQKLYEAKLMSYPRTDCEYLSSHENFRGILNALSHVPEYAEWIAQITDKDIERVKSTSRWINDKALEESGHSALRPTENVPDFNNLNQTEQVLYDMVARRFIAIFLPDLIQEKILMTTKIDDKTFRSSGIRLLDPGFSSFFGTKFTDEILPPHVVGDEIAVDEFVITESVTKKPKRFTSPELIAMCENPHKYLSDISLKSLGKRLKIGTPATRSTTIQKLMTRDRGGKYGYLTIKRSKKSDFVVPTQIGEDIIRNLGDCDICKVDLTGIWEEQLEEVRKGIVSRESLEQKMKQHVSGILTEMKETPMQKLGKHYVKIAPCPSCGGTVYAAEKGCFCNKWKDGCRLWLPRSKWGITFSDDEYVCLLNGQSLEKVCKVDRLSENGDLEVASVTKSLKYDLHKGGLYDANEKVDRIMTCPSCGGDIMCDAERFYCTGPASGKTCDISGMRMICGALLSTSDIASLLSDETITVSCQKGGKSWDQKICYSKETNRVEFVKVPRVSAGLPCPSCKKSDLYEGEKYYRCMNSKCGFVLWKTMSGHTFTDEELKNLCANGSLPEIHDFTSNAGKRFRAGVKVNKRNHKLEFVFKK